MQNRITHYLTNPLDSPSREDFWYLRGEFGGFVISAAVARGIARALDRLIVPQWITFRDLSGSEIRVRSRDIRSLVEATKEQRAADRAFARAREEEEKQDRDWDCD